MAELIGVIMIFAVGVCAYFIYEKMENPGLVATLIIGAGAVIVIVALFNLIVAPLQ